jgi:uncharacterized peroxidase-related enzyme
MSRFPLHTPETAPADAKATLAAIQSKMGFLPNLYGKLAAAPAALEAYTTLSGIFDKTSLSPAERQTVLLAASVENKCGFCVAAHSAGAKRAKAPHDVVAAIRERKPVADPRLGALADFTQAIVRERGWVGEPIVTKFVNAGFTPQQVVEVVVGVTLKTLSNYTNHIVDVPLNEQLAGEQWSAA